MLKRLLQNTNRKLLRSKYNNYPEWYAEYPINILTTTFDNFNSSILDKLKQDVLDNGLIHPIVIRSPFGDYQTDPNPLVDNLSQEEIEKIFYVYVGNQRIKVAEELGYTYISVYHVKADEDARFLVHETQMQDFVTY